jgi:tetratricopeptide (TPR) repeat protein
LKSSHDPILSVRTMTRQTELATVLDLLRRRRPSEALARLDQAPASLRAGPGALARYAYAYSLLGRIQEATRAARAALDATWPDASDLDLVGNSLVLCHQPALAYEAFKRVLALVPGDAGAMFNLAAAARFVGETGEAERLYGRVIARAPDIWEAYRNRAELRRQTPDSNHVGELRLRLASRPPPAAVVQLSYALGKELEDLGDYAAAFAAFAQGAAVRRAHMRYDVGEDLQALDLIGRTFDADYCAPARAPAPTDGPIFILGLPRTGSTLLERMLGRHSHVQPLGELQTFASALVTVTLSASLARPAGKAALIAASATTPPGAIGRAYLEGVAPLRDARPLFIDKLPQNALYAGIIARALPGARIIHLTRDPADTGVAMFKSLFEEGYPFSYDLKELGAYISAHGRLMAHWRMALGPRLIEISYERLSLDPEGALREVLAALDLAFEPACLAPETASAPVMTASASQVREAVHTRSIRSADRYARWIGPMLEALRT